MKRRAGQDDGAVAERAVGELLLRLRRARSRPGVDHSAVLGDAERAVFKKAMEKRQKVLEGALGIAVAQMAVYSAAIRTAPRPFRALYGLGCLSATTQFTRHRASTVTRDMLSSILNLPEESSLGNEARIILADLEGPDGPIYSTTVDESVRKAIYERALAQPRSADAGDRHPQLFLQPRLLVNMGSVPASSATKPAGDRTAAVAPPPPENRTVVNTGRKAAREAQEELDPYPPLPPLESDDDGADVFPHGVAPYDFAAAARAATGVADVPGDSSEDRNTDSTESLLTPAQRRAAERQRRRESARITRRSHAAD